MPIVPSDSQNETPAAPVQPMTPVETSPTSGTGGLSASTVAAPAPSPPPSPVIPQQSSEPAPSSNLFPLQNYEDVKIRAARATQYGKTPEQAARIFSVEQKTGYPTQYIEENLDEVEKQSEMQGFSAADFAKRSPKFASWIAQNPNNYALSKDDLDNGRGLESAVNDYSLMQSAHDSLYKGFADFNAGLAKLPAFAYDIAAVPQNLASKIPGLEGLETRAPSEWYNNSVTKYFEEKSKISLDNNPDLHADMLEMISKKQYERAGRAVFANVVTNAPNAIALMFGAGAGLAKQSLAFAGAQTGAQAAGSEESQKVDPLTGTIAAVTKGGFEAVFEEMGTLSVLEKWSKGLMNKVGRTSATEVIKNFSKMMVSSFLQEGSEEAVTSAAQDMTDYLTGVNPGAIDGMGKRMLEAGIIGGFSGTGMTAPAGFGMSVIHARANKQTELQKNFYKAIGESAEASKIRERLPEKYREMAEKVMKDGPVENIYIPVEKFTELFQSYEDGGLPGAITELGIDKEFQEAKETGGLVKIKTSVWADKMAGTTHYNAASSDITFDPQSFTENESKEATKILADDTNTFDPSMFDGEKAIEGMTVQQQVQKMLEDTGMSPENARKNAIVHRFFNVFGKRLGKTAEQLFGEYNLSITRPVANAQVNNFNPQDAAKNKDLAKYDPEVLKTILQDANETKGDASTFNPETNQRAPGFRGGPAYIASSDYPTKDIQIAFNKASQGMELTPYQNEIVQKLYDDSGYAPKKPFDPETILLQGGDVTKTKEFKNWFQDSKVVDEDGKPLAVHHGGLGATDIEIFDTNYSGQTTGNNTFEAFHFTDNAEVAQDYSRQSFNRRYQDDPESLVTDGIVKKIPDFKGDYKKQYAFVEKHANKRLGTSEVYLSIQNPIEIDLSGERVDVAYIERLTNFAKNGVDENGEFEEFHEKKYGIFNEETEEYSDVVPIDGIIITNMIDDISPASNKVAHQYIVWDNTNIKSVENRGTFDQNDPNILYQSKEAPTQSPLGFFSQMQAEIEKMDFKSMPVKDFLNRLKNIPGIKAEEIEFSGLIDFLNIAEHPNDKIEKSVLKEFFESNGGVKLEQVVLGEADRDVADSVSGIGDVVWGEQERDYSSEGDDISSELDYYLRDNDEWYKENEEEVRKDLLDNDAEDYGEWNTEVDPPEFVFESALAEKNLKRDIKDRMYELAEQAARDSVENDEYRWRYSVDLEIDGGGRGNTYTLYGNDETGWYNSDAGELGNNLNEAKIRMVSHLIDQGIIEGDKSQLIKADELEWRSPTSKVDYEKRRKAEVAYFKKNKEKFIEIAKNDVDYWGDSETPTQDEIESRASDLADSDLESILIDPNNEKADISIRIDSDLLDAHIQGNNVKGWEVVYYPGRKKDGFNTDELQAKTVDDAKKEAIQHLVSKGLVTGSTPVEGGKSPDLPTGKAKFGTYIIKDGESDNYREFLLQLKFPKMEKFVYSNHFSQENIVAHVRVTDREINGKKTLFIEEVQSDWHQQGRERGYEDKESQKQKQDLYKERDEKDEQLRLTRNKLEGELLNIGNLGFRSEVEAVGAIRTEANFADRFDLKGEPKIIELGNKYRKEYKEHDELNDKVRALESAVPNAPLKQTDAWAALAMKRMMRVAVDGGYEAIAWTPGSVHSDRWGTDQIGWAKKDDHFLVGASELRGGNAGGMNMEEVARQRGILLERNGEIVKTKEDLQKVVSDTLNRERNDRSLQSLTDSIWKQMQENPSGERKPRAEGMEFMYDNMLKKVAEKLTKKLDPSVKVQKVGIPDTAEVEKNVAEYTGPELTIDELDNKVRKILDNRDPWSVSDSGSYNRVIKEMGDGKSFKEAMQSQGTIGLAEKIGGNLEFKDIKGPDIQSHFMEITPMMREKISEGFSLFQSADQVKRGRILFDSNGNFNIEFLKNADATTFLHETAHFFLEVYGDQASKPEAPAAVREDYAKILKYLGVQSRDQIGVDQHEKFAESWEKYLMEGNVPVSELREVFNTIKAWFIGVYKSIAAAYPGVKLSADIRGVFDRMLATEEEIERALHEIQATPLIPNVDGVLSKEEAEKYVKLIEQERDIAADQARAKAMKTLTREMTKIRKAREIEIRKEVTAEVDKEPGQVILTMIRTGQTPGREDLPSEFKNFKLSRRITNQLFDPKIVENLPNGIFTKDGQHPNVVAGLLMGPLASGADLITLLANTPNRKELIEQRTQEQMNQEFPDPILDGSIVQNAMEAVHNEAGAERRNFEIDVMMKSKPAAVKGMIKKITDRKITVAQFRNRAEIIIGTTAIREIRPVVYMRGEIKHAKEAVRLFLKGDFDGAIEAKQKEILNHELYRVAIKAQEEVQKAQDRFNKVFQKDEKLAKNRDMAYINAARALLAEFKIGNSDYDADHYLSSIQKYFPEVYTQIKEIVDSSIANAADHRDVSFNVFMDMANTFKSLWDMSRLNHQITIDGMKMDRISAQDEMNTVLEDLSKDKGKGEEFARARNEKDERKFTFGAMKSALRRVETWVDQMDSGRIGGPFRKFIWEPVSGGVIQYRLAKNQTIAKFLKILKDHTKGFSEVSIPAKELVGLPNDAGVASPYLFQNKAELLGAMLHIGNESNLRKLLVGNGWGSLDEDGNLDTSNWDSFLKRMHSENILQKEDYDFLQSAWDLMAELKPGAQKAHYEIYGYHFAEVTNHEFETPFGKYKGGYAPASIDRLRTKNAKAQLRAIEDGTSANMFPAPLNGFSKKRVENYTVPLSMNLNLLPMHVDQVLRFTHITPRVKDVTKMLFDKSFRANLEAFDPHVIDHFLLPWLQRSTSQSVVTPSGNRVVDRFFRKLRSKTGMATMFLNVTNTLQQYTGILVAAVKVDPKHLRNETWNFVKNSKEMSAFAYEKSDFMKTKINFQMSETQKEIVKILDKPTGTEKVSEWFEQNAYALQGLAQNQVDMIVWHAAYSQAQEDGINHKISVQLADSAVRTTQGTFGPEDVSMFETGSPMGRLFTMFSSYFNMLGNLLGSEYGKALQQELGMKKTALRAFYIYAAGFMIPAVMSESILAVMSGKGLDADDDDDYLDDFMALFFGSQLKTGLALAPVAGPAVMAGINRFNAQQWDDRISLSPAMSMLEATVGVPYDISRDIEKGKLSKNTVRDSLTLLSLMSGVPVLPFAKPVGYLQDVDSGRADPSNPLDFARGLITGKPGSK